MLPRPARWPTGVAIVLALIASGLAIAGWFRPTPPPPPAAPTFTDQQVADAKTRACTAFAVVDKGVIEHTNNRPTDDPILGRTQTTGAALSLAVGSSYIRGHLDTATPQPLDSELERVSAVMLDLAANVLANMKDENPTQAKLMSEARTTFDRVAELCK